ncbi:hypothetical protein EON64_17255, partial [archaeon]
MFFVQQFLWIPFARTGVLYGSELDEAPYYCNASALAGWLSFFTQISLLGSELCFFIISLDMRVAYTNPFSSYKHNRIRYLLIVLLASLGTAACLMLFGPQVYGLSSLGVVWVQDRRVEDDASVSPNYAKLLLYYIPSVVIYTYCTWANFQVYKSGAKELSNTISNRWTIMLRSKRYTLGFVVYGAVVYSVEILSTLATRRKSFRDPVSPYFFAFRGVWSLLVILYSNASELSW